MAFPGTKGTGAISDTSSTASKPLSAGPGGTTMRYAKEKREAPGLLGKRSRKSVLFSGKSRSSAKMTG